MTERRRHPRVEVGDYASGFTVMLIIRRFLLRDRAVSCRLRNYSEGGMLVYVKDDDAPYISRCAVGTPVSIISEDRGLSFRTKRKGKIVRIEERDGRVSVAVAFDDRRIPPR